MFAMSLGRLLVTVVTCSLVILGGCHAKDGTATVTSGEAAASSLVIYQLDGERNTPNPVEGSPEDFYGWRILRNVTITDPARIETTMETLREQIATPGVGQMRCFIPRHGIRHVSEGGDTVDYVICYQCNNYRSYENGDATSGSIGGDGRWLDRPLSGR